MFPGWLAPSTVFFVLLLGVSLAGIYSEPCIMQTTKNVELGLNFVSSMQQQSSTFVHVFLFRGRGKDLEGSGGRGQGFSKSCINIPLSPQSANDSVDKKYITVSCNLKIVESFVENNLGDSQYLFPSVFAFSVELGTMWKLGKETICQKLGKNGQQGILAKPVIIGTMVS